MNCSHVRETMTDQFFNSNFFSIQKRRVSPEISIYNLPIFQNMVCKKSCFRSIRHYSNDPPFMTTPLAFLVRWITVNISLERLFSGTHLIKNRNLFIVCENCAF